MRVHGKLETSRVNGPGLRAVLWLQGCELGCAGCWNPKTHDRVGTASEEMFGQDLVNWVAYCYDKYRIEGLTLSGGEPIHQIAQLIWPLEVLRKKLPWISVGMYSGYSEKELLRGHYAIYHNDMVVPFAQKDVPVVQKGFGSPRWNARCWKHLRNELDFAVLGRYNQLKPGGEPMLTSTNQELKFYSGRYDQRDFPPQSVEININETGNLVTLTGFPTH